MCGLNIGCGLFKLGLCCGGATGAQERNASNVHIEQPEKTNAAIMQAIFKFCFQM